MKRIVAGLVGGLIVWLWGALAHTALPLGNVGLRDQVAAEDAVIESLGQSLTQGDGIYFVPGMNQSDMGDATKTAAWAAKASSGPYAMVIYSAKGLPGDPANMGPQLIRELITNVLSAFLVVFVLTAVAGGYWRRVATATAMGAFSWLAVQIPQWNWYHFPLDFTLAAFPEQTVGWFLAGLAMAKLLKPANG